MPTRLIIPIINKRVTTFKGPTWYLADDVAVESLSSEDYGLSFANAPFEYNALLSPKAKCIRVEGIDHEGAVERAYQECIKTAFVLNYFRRSSPVAMAFALQVTTRRKARLDRVIDLGAAAEAHGFRVHSYQIQSGIARDTITDFYKVATKAHLNHPNILLTLGRYNSALFRQNAHDRIVDITISLESLISGTTELRYRFANHNAWAAEPDDKKRHAAFKLLMSLYDARSAIVHGAAMTKKEYDKKITRILDSWDEVLSAASKAIGYHLLFLYSGDITSWHRHQSALSLGQEKRIT